MVYMARSYRDLLVWQKAKRLALDVYKSTESFPKSETYGTLLELDTQVLIASDLGYLNESASEALGGQIYQVLGLLDRLIASLVVSTLKP
jgi:hypothetical protein